MKTTRQTKNAMFPQTWERMVVMVNKIVAARAITLKQAAKEIGVEDYIKFHKWMRPHKGVREPRDVDTVLRFSVWIGSNQSFLADGAPQGSNKSAPTTTTAETKTKVT